MILAELELFCSRPIAPTRRVALGHVDLPVDPAPGVGGILLGAVVAASMKGLEPGWFDDLDRLAIQVERDERISQPRLRHRFQTDRVGLLRSRHTLRGDGEELRFDLDRKGTPAQNVLAAVYAAGQLPYGPQRSLVLSTVRKAMRWSGGIDHRFIAYLTGVGHRRAWSLAANRDPVAWALEILELEPEASGSSGRKRHGRAPERHVIQRRFRELLRRAHPDHGGENGAAAHRISELAEARRILLATT